MPDFRKATPCPRASSRDERLWRNVLRMPKLSAWRFPNFEVVRSDAVSLNLLALVCVRTYLCTDEGLLGTQQSSDEERVEEVALEVREQREESRTPFFVEWWFWWKGRE